MLILPMLLGAFDHRRPRKGTLPPAFPGPKNHELASILLCPAATSTFSAAIQARFTLASKKKKKKLYFEGYEDIRAAIAREKQLKGWRREKKLKLIRAINPEFKA